MTSTLSASASSGAADPEPVDLRAYWTARRVAVVLVVGGVLLRLWVVGAGWFLDSDHVLRIRAGEEPFDVAYFTAPDVVGSTPGMAALQWPLSRAWPWDFTPMAVVLVLAQTAVLVLTAVLCRQLWGDRRVGLAVLGLVSLSALGPAAASWWSAAVPATAVQLVIVCTLVSGVAWLRGRRAVVLVPAALVWVVAVPFSALAVVALPLTLLVLPLLLPGERPRTLRWLGPLVVSLVLAVGAWALLRGYLLPRGLVLGPPDVLAAALGSTATSSLVALVGGPLAWAGAAAATAVVAPPVWWSAVVLQTVLVVGVLAAARSVRVGLVWIWTGAWVVLCALDVVQRSGGGDTAALAARTLRWSGPLVLPLALALGVSAAVLAGPVRRAARLVLGPRVAPLLAPVVSVVTIGLVLVAVVSLAGFRGIWAQNPSRYFLVGASAALGQSPQDQTILDQPVPPEALSPLLAPYDESGRFLGSWQPRPPFGEVTTSLRVWTPLGALVPGAVSGVAARPGPVARCGWLLRDSVSIPLQSPAVDFDHTVRLTYLSSGTGTASVQVGAGEAVTVPVRQGFGEAAVTIAGGGDRVRLTRVTGDFVLCTDDVAVGTPVVAPPAPVAP